MTTAHSYDEALQIIMEYVDVEWKEKTMDCPKDCSICAEEDYFLNNSCDLEEDCLKEINPDFFPGVFFGVAYLFDTREGACWLCPQGRGKLLTQIRP